MSKNKATPESITLRPSLKFYKDVDPGLYNTLKALPEQIRGEFIHSMLTRAAVGVATPLNPLPAPFPPSGGSQVLPALVSAGADRPSPTTIETDTASSLAKDSAKPVPSTAPPPLVGNERLEREDATRALDAVWGDVGDAFDYAMQSNSNAGT